MARSRPGPLTLLGCPHAHCRAGLSHVEFDGEPPRREDLGPIFDELDYQMACQAYLWALPLVSYAQWQQQHREVFGATTPTSCTT